MSPDRAPGQVDLLSEWRRVAVACDARQYQRSRELVELVFHAAHYVGAAQVQTQRIAALETGTLQSLWDAHFLFVCWNHVRVAFERITKGYPARPKFDQIARSGLPGVGNAIKTLENHASSLAHYKDAREHFEHIDERFALSNSAGKVRHNLPNGHWRWESPRVDCDSILRWGPHEWDVGPSGYALLLTIFTEMIDALVDDMQNGQGADFREPWPLHGSR